MITEPSGNNQHHFHNHIGDDDTADGNNTGTRETLETTQDNNVGDILEEHKKDGITRLYFQNINGLK
jgi:hypothetical protein